MQIVVQASGGFAGLETSEVARIDTDTLPPARRERIESLIKQLAREADTAVGADLFRYDILIEDQNGQRRMTISDSGEPGSPMQNLLLELGAA